MSITTSGGPAHLPADYIVNSIKKVTSSEMTKNRQKKRITQSRFSQFFYRYGIFWMPPGESSHPGGSEYVWQRGVEGVLG